jgi:hypothetical protein
MHPPLESHHEIVDHTGHFVAHHPAFGPWVPLVTGITYAVMTALLPEEVMTWGVKILAAFPLGLMAGLGHASAAWIIRKTMTRAKKPS